MCSLLRLLTLRSRADVMRAVWPCRVSEGKWWMFGDTQSLDQCTLPVYLRKGSIHWRSIGAHKTGQGVTQTRGSIHINVKGYLYTHKIPLLNKKLLN